MSKARTVDWTAVMADPRFILLERRKSRVLWGLMAFSVLYYFALPFGAAYWQDSFRIPVFGALNRGLVFALSEFVVAWLVAIVYAWVADRQFDRLAEEIVADLRRAGEA